MPSIVMYFAVPNLKLSLSKLSLDIVFIKSLLFGPNNPNTHKSSVISFSSISS